MFECMEDCIHLKACRRIQAIGRKYRLSVPRYCTEECSAYVCANSESYITVDEAINYARQGADGIRSGYDSYDVYTSCDLNGMTLGEIIESKYDDRKVRTHENT